MSGTSQTRARSADPRDCVVVAFARTPFGRFGGALSALDVAALGRLAIDEAVARARIDAEAVEALYAGVAMIGGAMLTPARRMVLASSLPERTPSLAVDRACCSGLTALALARRQILAGEADLVIAGGVEALSATPRLLPREMRMRPGPVAADDPLTLRAPFLDKAIAAYTGEEALRNGVTRRMQDEWALESHGRYFEGEAAGHFAAERFAVDMPQARLATDEQPRRDTSLEKLAALATIYGGPTVTAGNAPGLSDGAAFLVLASRAFATAHGLAIRATLRAHAEVAGGPTSGTSTPAEAIRAVIARAGLGIADMRLVEINEAFAATPLVSTLRLADGDPGEARSLRARTNLHGGAVAIGHPLGASGARLVMTLAASLERLGGGAGVAAICGGFGQGDAMIVEVA
ncbi:MAG: thiolase family protein [Hyphomicrobiaceae bacterium]